MQQSAGVVTYTLKSIVCHRGAATKGHYWSIIFQHGLEINANDLDVHPIKHSKSYEKNSVIFIYEKDKSSNRGGNSELARTKDFIPLNVLSTPRPEEIQPVGSHTFNQCPEHSLCRYTIIEEAHICDTHCVLNQTTYTSTFKEIQKHLHKEDLNILRGSDWLNDIIIDSYLDLLNKRHNGNTLTVPATFVGQSLHKSYISNNELFPAPPKRKKNNWWQFNDIIVPINIISLGLCHNYD